MLNMPLLLLGIITSIIALDSWIPLTVKSILYAISLSIKSIIIFLLPLIIFALLFKVAVKFARNATKVIALIFGSVIISNYLSTFISQWVGRLVYRFDLSLILPKTMIELAPAWEFKLPTFIANDKAMFLGLILGIIFSLLSQDMAIKVANWLESIVTKMLSGITYLIPFFVAGFVIKMQYDGVMTTIIKDYALIFIIIAIAQFCYISLIYFIANNKSIQRSITSLKNMLPAAIAGFSTMSSAAAMPLTIVGTEKNCQNKDLASSIIPATVNIHLIGDCFAIPIFAFAVLKNFGMPEPTFIGYLIFAFYFVLAKFSVAAVPGGGILVMLPILADHLSFNPEMMSLITALYILFDPIITCANVLGNGGFAMILDKIFTKLRTHIAL
jgi:Na+/H+-dicarboxylate symporter